MSAQTDIDTDPFTSLLHLEDTLYTTAYASGVAAGARAGRIEGRIFGLEKGFEKFASLGALHGRAVVWGARTMHSNQRRNQGPERAVEADADADIALPSNSEFVQERESEDVLEKEKEKEKEVGTGAGTEPVLPPLLPNPRLEKHISTLHALTEPLTFSSLNTEEAVADFDERFKRAGAKLKIIERMVGETDSENNPGVSTEGGKGGARRTVKINGESRTKNTDDGMEDFSIRGARGVRM